MYKVIRMVALAGVLGVAAGGANIDTETPTCLPAPDTQMQ